MALPACPRSQLVLFLRLLRLPPLQMSPIAPMHRRTIAFYRLEYERMTSPVPCPPPMFPLHSPGARPPLPPRPNRPRIAIVGLVDNPSCHNREIRQHPRPTTRSRLLPPIRSRHAPLRPCMVMFELPVPIPLVPRSSSIQSWQHGTDAEAGAAWMPPRHMGSRERRFPRRPCSHLFRI